MVFKKSGSKKTLCQAQLSEKEHITTMNPKQSVPGSLLFTNLDVFLSSRTNVQ